MTRNTSRRDFLGQSAAIGAGLWIAPQGLSMAQDSPAQTLTAACIGVGGKGSSDSSHIAEQGVKIVGICDVDKNTLTKKSREFKDAEQFTDYRECLTSSVKKSTSSQSARPITITLLQPSKP